MNRSQHRRAGFFFVLVFCAIIFPNSLPGQQKFVSAADSVEVASVTFSGEGEYDDDVLASLISTRESPAGFWTWIYDNLSESLGSAPEFFDAEVFQQDIQRLAQFYRENGYFNARVGGNYALDTVNTTVRVEFHILPGVRSFIDSIYFQNLDSLPGNVRERIYSNPLIKVGDPYTEAGLRAEIERIITLLTNTGYPDALADSVHVQRFTSTNNVHIFVRFLPGRRYFFGKIFEDTTRTRKLNLARKIIYDRLEFKTGDVYSEVRREASEANLNRLGIFSTVRLQPLPPDTTDAPSDRIPIKIILEERNRHELAPAFLVNSYDNRFNAGAEIKYLFRNIFGGAQTFSVNLSTLWHSLETKSYKISLMLDQPYLWDNYTRGFFNINILSADEKSLYSVQVLQGIVGLTHTFTKSLSGKGELTFEQQRYDVTDPKISGDVLRKFGSATGINYRNFIAGVTIFHDKTNDIFNPTSGLSQQLTIEHAGLLKQLLEDPDQNIESIEYLKSDILLRGFTPAGKSERAVLAVKFRLGGIFRYGGSKERNLPVPIARAYFAGGSNSIRGWTARELSTAPDSLTSLGLNALLESSLELRWNAFRGMSSFLPLDLDRFWLVLFFDAGNAWKELRVMNTGEIAMAFGVGLRYDLFFGPIRIDFGMKMFDPSVSNHRWFTERKFFSETLSGMVIHFGIGQAF